MMFKYSLGLLTSLALLGGCGGEHPIGMKTLSTSTAVCAEVAHTTWDVSQGTVDITDVYEEIPVDITAPRSTPPTIGAVVWKSAVDDLATCTFSILTNTAGSIRVKAQSPATYEWQVYRTVDGKSCLLRELIHLKTTSDSAIAGSLTLSTPGSIPLDQTNC